jgi:hypothetical protein
MLILGFDSGMLKRDPKFLQAVDLSSGDKYAQLHQKQNPDRKLVYYGAALFVQYVVPVYIVLSLDFAPSQFHFGCIGINQSRPQFSRIFRSTY